MSTTYLIRRDGETNEFDDEQQFRDTVNLLEDNGVDFETEERINGQEINTDGSGDGASTPDTQTEPTDVEVVEQPEKPERSITDDPVDWLGGVGEFTYEKNGKTAINKKGLRVLEHWYDIDIDDSEVVVGPEETDHTYCRVRAEATMPDGRTAVAHGSAHVDRGDDPWLLVEMADTRAKSRVLLDITGMGAVAVSELQNEL